EDIVEESPVVGGAAATDRGMATSADASTPAARASALHAPRPASPAKGAAAGAGRGGGRAPPASAAHRADPHHPRRAAQRWRVGVLALHPVALLRGSDRRGRGR